MSQQVTQSSARPMVVPDAQIKQDIGPAPTASVGTGWATFAGVLFMIAGLWNVIAGWAALVRKEYFDEASMLYHNLEVVAWVWIGIGAIQVLTSYLIFARTGTGRRAGRSVDARVVLHDRCLPRVGPDDPGDRRVGHLRLSRARRRLRVNRSNGAFPGPDPGSGTRPQTTSAFG